MRVFLAGAALWLVLVSLVASLWAVVARARANRMGLRAADQKAVQP